MSRMVSFSYILLVCPIGFLREFAKTDFFMWQLCAADDTGEEQVDCCL